MTGRPTRVLVVDDSAFARKVLREVLAGDDSFEVVGFARDGLEALEKIEQLAPDVVTLDLMMPHLDGVGVLASISGPNPPAFLVVSISDANSAMAVEALQRGAFDLVHKPTALATDRLYELSSELRTKVKAAAESRGRPRPGPAPGAAIAPVTPAARAVRQGTRLVVIGTSTGGPQALTRLVSALSADFPVPIAVALHIPEGYTEALARRLDQQAALSVVEGATETELRPGLVVIAPGGAHLLVERRQESLVAVPSRRPTGTPHVPSVDLLFESAAAAAGPGVLGVVLTGMGSDGLQGARAIRAGGGRMLTESEASCVVYGMPRVICEAGLSAAQAPLERMAALLVEQL